MTLGDRPYDGGENALMYKTTWLDEWMAEYGDRLIRFCWSYTQDPQVAEDIVQETFLRLWETVQKDPSRKLHAGWLFTVARRLAIDHYRVHVREATTVTAYPPPPEPFPFSGVCRCGGIGSR